MDKSGLLNLEKRIGKLLGSYNELRLENNSVLQEIRRKEERIAELELELNTLKEEFNNIKVARSIELVSDSKSDTKEEIESLVREIDKCIALLNA